jgi:hypothetical protein
MQSRDLSAGIKKSGTHILVEGPAWGDADFYGHWLLEAVKAQRLLNQAKRDDAAFQEALEIAAEFDHCLNYGILATFYVSQFAKDDQLQAFIVDIPYFDLIDFAFMVEMGFFVLTGDRYQMVLPQNLDMELVKRAHLKFAGPEEDWIPLERSIVAIPHASATQFQRLLGEMNQDQRLADRRLLLFLD